MLQAVCMSLCHHNFLSLSSLRLAASLASQSQWFLFVPKKHESEDTVKHSLHKLLCVYPTTPRPATRLIMRAEVEWLHAEARRMRSAICLSVPLLTVHTQAWPHLTPYRAPHACMLALRCACTQA
jgi:hypothetical protein